MVYQIFNVVFDHINLLVDLKELNLVHNYPTLRYDSLQLDIIVFVFFYGLAALFLFYLASFLVNCFLLEILVFVISVFWTAIFVEFRFLLFQQR